MSLLLAALLAKTVVPTAELPIATADPCAIFDRQQDDESEMRTIGAADLTALADIGRSDPGPSESPFGISPDGKHIAFLVRRANAEQNDYCQRLLVGPMDDEGHFREVDRGGAFIRGDFSLRNFVSIKAGTAKVITPRWSPDGRRIAFLKQQGATHQVWLVDSDGKQRAYQVSSLRDNVDNFVWAGNNETLIVATRPGIRQQAEAIARESLTGFLFDERFAPQMADRPVPIAPVTTVYNAVDINTGGSRQATAAEIALLNPGQADSVPALARGFSRSSRGGAAWLQPLFPDRVLSPLGIRMRLPDGTERSCDKPCEGIRQIFWSADGSRLYGLKKTDWIDGKTSVLRWKVSDVAPQLLRSTNDEMIGCTMSGEELVCALENAITPRRLVALDIETGKERLIFNPNPGFRNITLGQVQRFTVRNAFGIESNAHLVLPPGHRPGDKHPLVVVQYTSFGFLRGGTGDEFPIHPLAAKGFAVLSFSRPWFVPAATAAKTEFESMKANRREWIDRRSVQSSLEMAVKMAVATGLVDEDRMGISGFSDGATSIQWALINSSLFKVAAMGSCCDGMNSFALAGGPAFIQQGRELGLAFFQPGVEEIWKPLSLTLNVERIDAPILIQITDGEYEGGLDVMEKFKSHGKAIELYVFENEPHVIYQPAHRLAMYERSIEWFQFWLMGIMNCSPAKSAQYARWKNMKNAPSKAGLRCEPGTSVVP